MSLYLPISVAVPLVGVGETSVEVGQPPSCIRVSLYLPFSVAVPLVGVGEAGVEVGQTLLYQFVSLSTYLCGYTSGRGWRGWF